MSNVLIRDVPAEDLEEIRSAAARRGTSLQNCLREAMHAQAAYLRRQEALTQAAHRLRGRRAVTQADRDAVLDAVDAAHSGRAEHLSDPQR